MSERAIPSIHGEDHGKGGPDPIPGGDAIYAVEVYEVGTAVEVGDDAFEWMIPEDLDGAVLLKVETYVTAPGTGSTECQFHNIDAAVDMLSTKAIIDSGDLNSKDSGTPPVVNVANAEVAWGDHIRLDIDGVGAGAEGLGFVTYWTPLRNLELTLQGSQGEPGGVSDWTGQWATSTNYVAGEAVSNNGSSYVARTNHASDASTEPGVGASWETAWMVLSQAQGVTELALVLNGSGYVLDTGIKAYLPVAFACTIVEATLLADISGSMVIDIWKDSYGAFPPVVGDSITGSTPPTLSSQIKNQDTALTGWTTAINAGDVLVFNVDSCSLITNATLSLKVERT